MTFLIPFTQYLMPDGKKRAVKWECTTREQEIKARSLLDAGAVFEIEMLQTGQISMTCEMRAANGDDYVLAHEICENDAAVVEAVQRLVERAHDYFLEHSSQ